MFVLVSRSPALYAYACSSERASLMLVRDRRGDYIAALIARCAARRQAVNGRREGEKPPQRGGDQCFSLIFRCCRFERAVVRRTRH